MENHLEIIIDNGKHSLTKNREIAEAEDYCSGIVLKCDYLDKRDTTIWSWERHFIGLDLENAQVNTKNPNSSILESTRIKLIRGICKHDIEWDYGKLLVTYLLNGRYKELICDAIYRGEGQNLFLKKPKCIEECVQCFPNYRVDLKNNDGYNHILKHSYSFTYGNDLYMYMPLNSIDTIRIDPYPDNSNYANSYSCNPHTHIGVLSLQIDILDKSILFQNYLGRGVVKFDSIFEMLQTIVEWRKRGEEGYYPIKVSEISYTDNLNAELSIESDTFSFIDLEEKLDFTVTMNSKHHENGDDDWKSYADDAYEGYSPEYLGLDG